MKKRIAILASGGGSNAQALLDAMKARDYPAECVLIFSNKRDARVLDRGREAGVRVEHLDPRAFDSRDAFEADLIRLLNSIQPDYICLAGYMLILSDAFVAAFRGRLINIHPSLLPNHGGPGMYGHHVHEAVIAAGDHESGATVHYVIEEVDAGTIIQQAKVAVDKGETAESLAPKVLKQEHQLYPAALRSICESA